MSSKLPTRREKPHSTKPYDRPKSFLQRVTKHVANYLPTWLNPTSWVVNAPPLEDKPSEDYAAVVDEETGEETEEECDVAGLSESSRPAVQKGSLHRPTAGLLSPESASFTRKPLERTSPTPQQIIANGDDHSDNSETSASTSGCSSLAPSQDRKRATTSDSRAGSHLRGLQVSKHHLEKIQQQLNSNPLFTVPGTETAQRSSPVPSLDRITDSVSVKSGGESQKTRDRSQKRVSVGNYHSVENVEKDVESSSTRTSLWSEDDKNSETSKRPRTTRPQAVAPNKRPCFSVSAFGSPLRWRGRQNIEGSGSPVSQDRTRLPSESSTSPFCESHSVYGGASAYKKARISTPYNSVLHAEAVKVRHSGSREVLSSAAQKVLNVLENMSTPLTDAKKIPVENVTRDFALSYTPSIYARKPIWKDTPRPPVSSGSGPPTYSFPVQKTSQEPTPLLAMLNQTTPLRNADFDNRVSRTGSQETEKRSVGAIRSRVTQSLRPSKQQKGLEEEEPPSQPNLPNIALVPKDVLPSVSFNFPVLTSTPIAEAHPTVNPKKQKESLGCTLVLPDERTSTVKMFTFSSPIENKPPEEVPEDSTSDKENSFQFRSPVIKTSSTGESDKSVPAPVTTSKAPVVNFSFVPPVGSAPSVSPLRRKKPMEQTIEETTGGGGGLKPASELKVGGSVMDILGKPASGAKDDKQAPQKTGFGSAFQKKSTEWECKDCMVRNKDTDSSCVACTAPKPSLKPTSDGFGQRFAPPSSSWCCPTCMVNNTETDRNCVACTEPRPGSAKTNATVPAASTAPALGFKVPASPSKLSTSIAVKPSGKWECDTCWVKNDESLARCCSCETQRPGATNNAAGVKEAFSGFKFGQPKDTSIAASSSPFKFGLPDKQSEKSSTPSTVFGSKTETKNSDSQNTTGFKFGVPSAPGTVKQAEGFKFGSSTTSETPKSSEGFKFGVTASADSSKASEGFKFGLPVDKTSGASTDSGGFKFGSSSESSFKFGSSTNNASSETSTFKFGAPKEPVAKANGGQVEKDTKVTEITCDTVSSSTVSNKVEGEQNVKDTKTAGSVGFVFGGQPMGADEKLQTTPVLTFGHKSTDAPKAVQEAFTFGKPQASDPVVVPTNSGNDGKAPESSIVAAVPKPAVTVSQMSAQPLATTSIGSKQDFSGFKFGASAQSATDKPAEKATPAPMFKFGGQTASNSADKKLPGIVGGTAITAAVAPTSGLQFNFKGKDNDLSQATPITSSIFGASQAASPASSSLPAFTAAANTATVPSFGMVSQPLAVSSSSSSTAVCIPTTAISGSAQPAAQASSVGGFVFGSSTPAAQAPASNPGSFKFTFGNDAAKPMSFFGSTPSTTSSVPPTTTPFSFGKPALAPAPTNMVQPQPQQQQPMFTFGSGASSTNTSNSGGSAFGSGQVPKPVFGFNGQQTQVAGASTTFGQPAAPVAPASSEPFRFGATPAATPAAAPATGMFQLETPKPALTQSNNPVPTNLFRFGNTQPDNASSQQTMFGSTQSQPASGATFTFGSPAVPPMGSTFAPADSSTSGGAPFVFGSSVTNSGMTPAQPPASVSPFTFQANNAAANPFSVMGNNNAGRPVRKATRRLGTNKKK